MAKFYGVIGYVDTKDDGHGVWEEETIEKEHYGDILQDTRRYQQSGNVHDNIVMANRISIIATPFAMENSHLIRYVKFMGTKWKVSSIEVQYPRLILTLGDVYNG